MPAKSRKTIVVGVSGSIAAYKSADLVSKLVKRNHDVFVLMTHSAQEFIMPLTLRTLSKNPVTLRSFAESESWRPGHIELADRCDLLLVAPATANIIAELACGLAANPVTEVALATPAPVLIAPAMNGKMWLHPATKQNVQTLLARGAHFIGPEAGMLACGYEGLGRLWNVDGIVDAAEALLTARGKK